MKILPFLTIKKSRSMGPPGRGAAAAWAEMNVDKGTGPHA